MNILGLTELMNGMDESEPKNKPSSLSTETYWDLILLSYKNTQNYKHVYSLRYKLYTLIKLKSFFIKLTIVMIKPFKTMKLIT